MAEEANDDVVTMDDTIAETLRELTAREGLGASDNKATPAKDDKTASEAAGAEKEPKQDRPRDESGKFAKVEPAEKQEGAQEPVQAEQPLVTTTGQPIDITRAPASWKPAAKAEWANLSEPIRAEIYRRESDFMHGSKDIRAAADFGQSVRQVVEPYRMLIEAEGGTPEKAIADTLRTAALFRVGTPQQKLQALFQLDQQFNAGLGQYFEQQVQARLSGQPAGQPAPQQQQQFQDPRVNQILTSLQAQERQRATQEATASNQAVEVFMAAKDEKGQPLYPFVDNVLADMSARVASIRAVNPHISHEEVLKKAYDAAVWANPETRAVLIGQQQATANQSGDTQRKTDQARRASGTNMPKRGALPAGEALGSMDDTIRETYRQLAG